MMNVAILGGSFDPPHLGHVLIVRQVKECFPIDEVWLMPCAVHSFGKKLSAPAHRLAMAKTLEGPNITVSDVEVKRGGTTNTIETLEELSRKRPSDRLSFIIGSDQLKDFYRWPRWQDIIQKFGIIVFPREVALRDLGVRVKKAFRLQTIPKNIVLMTSDDLILTNVSSSLIRRRVKKGLPIDFLVPNGVNEYIREHKLYKLPRPYGRGFLR